MQLKKLYIKDFKILKEFTLEFPCIENKYISLLIGANGSGKSTIIEAIAEIFDSIIKNKTIQFEFRLEYSVTHPEVLIEAAIWDNTQSTVFDVVIEAKEKNEVPIISVRLPNGVELHSLDEINSFKRLSLLKDYLPSNIYKLIPDNIIVYYSGLSQIMKTLCEPHKKDFAINYKNGITNIPQVIFYFEPELYQIILLSLLSFEYGEIPSFLKGKAKIDAVNQIQITLHKPSWSKNNRLEDWWGAEGEVKRFLDYLEKRRDTGKIKLENVLNTPLRITLFSTDILYELRDYFGEERELFKVLYALYIGGFLENIEFSFINDNTTFSNISEGEQQAITIKGLVELLSKENTLYLFDEPDTYLHPKWQSNFFDLFVEEYNRIDELDNFIIKYPYLLVTTHSPMLISSLRNGDVYNMHKGIALHYSKSTYGRDSNTILSLTMDSVHRTDKIQTKIEEIENLINNGKLEEAKAKLEIVSLEFIDSDPILIRLSSIIKRKEIIGR